MHIHTYIHTYVGARADLTIHCPKSAGTGRLLLGSSMNIEAREYIGNFAHVHVGPLAFIDVEG